MLVINTAFQRKNNLDDGVIAIETSTMSSLDLPYDDLTIDQLDDFIEFWKWIPNTMLVPNTDLKPTLAADPKANSHTNPHPDLNPDPNSTPDAKPNANAEVHPKCCNLWCSHCDVSGSTTVVTYDGCIKNHERSENFPTMNERVARELIRAFQHSHSR